MFVLGVMSRVVTGAVREGGVESSCGLVLVSAIEAGLKHEGAVLAFSRLVHTTTRSRVYVVLYPHTLSP